MNILQGLAILLTLQSAGEALSRLLHLPYPGPVIGMVLLLGALRWHAVQTRVSAVATFLLNHLSLLFVPVGVGVVSQLGLLGPYGLRLLVVIVVSTWVGLAVTALALRWLMRSQPPATPARRASAATAATDPIRPSGTPEGGAH